MTGIHVKEGNLFVENILGAELAKKYGTPAFIYSSEVIRNNYALYSNDKREDDLICYAVKANSNLNILKMLVDIGSGFDVVSGNELKKCLLAGADKNKIVFSGVAKSEEEITHAIENEILSINIESINEYKRIEKISSSLNKKVKCALRVNPDITIGSHKYIETGAKSSKFGLGKKDVNEVSELALKSENIELTTIACHIGSQISDENLILQSLDYIFVIAEELKKQGHEISCLDIGGGLGIKYHNEKKGDPALLIKEIKRRLNGTNYKFILEPGRSIIGNAGILISKVEYIKEAGDKKFAIVDTGMNDLIRPSLYEAWHGVMELENRKVKSEKYDIAGPVCETGDVLATDRELRILPNDIIALMDVGAYGSVMSSNYNSRLKPVEILVTGDKAEVIRRRESFEDLIALET
ncbi:MAG: diaminopimelate decarboxylase [Pseudomonadota bacterium]|nr:diaminopimelate decarboxylase [Pseudomonadota bacterium]MEC8448256.1 diaminopimelate decarboxylase [Pseudomonadota bacterium]MED5349771.1 diaminopimelate decarboxylase [Pseudomonadota bacterium]|tara:strand:- start:388 stop:1620 length:1233 start_codon:yes stop_codon:yes gene_type:complete